MVLHEGPRYCDVCKLSDEGPAQQHCGCGHRRWQGSCGLGETKLRPVGKVEDNFAFSCMHSKGSDGGAF